MLKWRRDCPLLGRDTFMAGQDITWWESNWDDEDSRFLAFSLHDWCAASASKQADDDSIVWRPFCCEGDALPVSCRPDPVGTHRASFQLGLPDTGGSPCFAPCLLESNQASKVAQD
jgi:hypothetical protein